MTGCADLEELWESLAFRGNSRGLVDRFESVGCGLDVVQRTACPVVGPVIVVAVLRSLIVRRRFGPQTQ